MVALAGCAANTAPQANAAAPMPDAIAGTKWFVPMEGDAGERPRLEFGSDGRVTGHTGCNGISGTWRLEGGAVRLSALIMTKRACPGARDDMERRFLGAVNAQARLSIEGGRLVAVGQGGERLELSPEPAR
jgi:putative lipoprotein